MLISLTMLVLLFFSVDFKNDVDVVNLLLSFCVGKQISWYTDKHRCWLYKRCWCWCCWLCIILLGRGANCMIYRIIIHVDFIYHVDVVNSLLYFSLEFINDFDAVNSLLSFCVGKQISGHTDKHISWKDIVVDSLLSSKGWRANSMTQNKHTWWLHKQFWCYWLFIAFELDHI